MGSRGGWGRAAVVAESTVKGRDTVWGGNINTSVLNLPSLSKQSHTGVAPLGVNKK